ncbi:transketolase C-terminal domain-containing protein, partial [Prescottella equi]
ASHNGMWDLSLLGIVPGIRVAAPRDAATLREELDEALAVNDGPTVIRFPKGAVGEDVPAIRRLDGIVDVLQMPEGDRGDVLLVAVGSFAGVALEAAERLAQHGITAAVIDPRWVLPVPESLIKLAENFRMVVTIEDSGLHGGIGSTVSAALRAAGVDVPCRDLGVPQQFLDHASRDQIHRELGLTAQDVTRQVTGWVVVLEQSAVDSRQGADRERDAREVRSRKKTARLPW